MISLKYQSLFSSFVPHIVTLLLKFLNLGNDISGTISVWGCSVYYRTVIPGLHPPVLPPPTQLQQLNVSPDIAKCPLGVILPQLENTALEEQDPSQIQNNSSRNKDSMYLFTDCFPCGTMF